MLEKINNTSDLKALQVEELPILAEDIRKVLIEKASAYGGHLASNLCSVELTIALHYVFDSPKDKIIFDVSHQCYTHKILTGRKSAFTNPEEYDSVTGYTNPFESEHDFFNIGHTSTSISLACGFAKARDLSHGSENIIAVTGDSALDGGQSYEALNYAAEMNTGLIVVVNDNNMSIPENHGHLCSQLQELKLAKGDIPNNYFKAMGFEYLFVEDGHNIQQLVRAFSKVRGTTKPVLVHCCTVKGKGFAPAEANKEKWHHAHPFDLATGEFKKSHSVPKENYGSIVGEYLSNKIKTNDKVVAMTASVPACFGFNPVRRKEAGDHYIDVGISEQNMITTAASLAKGGYRPVTITESSFYQRAYDQVQQEVCINQAPITMLIAFSGINGHNDDTHIGFFDIALFGNIPGLVYLAPSNKEEYIAMLEWSIRQHEKPVAIRIPWNGVYHVDDPVPEDYSTPIHRIVRKGSRVAIMGLGSFFQLGEEVADKLLSNHGIHATVIDPLFASSLDEAALTELASDHELVVTLEDGILCGGFGAKVAQFFGPTSVKVLNCGFSMNIPRKFTKEQMMHDNGLEPSQIVAKIIKTLGSH